MHFIGQWLATAVAAAVATWLVPGLVPMGDKLTAYLVFALIIALVNSSVRPIMQTLSMPLTIVTLGLFHLIVNALALMLSSWLTLHIFGSGVYISGFGAALLGSIIISLVSGVVENLIGVD